MSENRKGFLIVIGCSMAIFWPGALIFGYPGVMAPFWQSMFHIGSGTLGNVIFFVLIAVGVFMFLAGYGQERYGTKAMIAIGVFTCSISAVIAGYAAGVIWLYAWAFIIGASSSFIYTPALTIVQRLYPHKRGFVSGIVNLTFGLSAAIMSPLFGYMLNSMGYLTMNLIVAAASLITGLVAIYIARAPDVMHMPAPALIPITANPSSGLNTVSGAQPSLTVQESIRTRSFWLLWGIWAMQGAATISMVILSTSYGLSKGFALESAILILMSFNIANGAGRLISGYLSDIIGRNLTMSIFFLAAGGAYFMLPFSSNLIVCSILAAFVGLSHGTLFTVSAPLVYDCFGFKHFGAIFGLIFTAYGFISGLLGPSLSGYLLDATGGDFFIVFLYLGVFCVLSGAGIRLVAPPATTEALTALSL
jgi:OFA family oxalate/formate antiporter-like MFS transporter